MSEMVRIRMTKLHSLFSSFLPNPSIKQQQQHHHLQLFTMHQHQEDEDHHLSYYSHHFRPPQALISCPTAPVSTSTNPIKFTYQHYLMQDGFHLSSAKKHKPDIPLSGGGARVVQPAGKKDRHSKVRTARGPRDRRVRLSPRTAIQFYDVQDRLGYDRPSKAIDWLIREAQSAIDALNRDLPNNAPPLIHEHLNVANPVSGFGFCLDGPAPPPELQAYIDHQQGLGLAWDCGSGNGNLGGGVAAEYFSGESLFCQREPLQSSFLNYSPINADFVSEFNFCNELANVTASATMKEDDQKMNFLHFED